MSVKPQIERTDDQSLGDGSAGIVQRQYAHFDVPLHLRSGKPLDSFTVAYETFGTLNADGTNAILICHALSGDSHVAGRYSDDPNETPGWWDEAVGPGKMFDTNRYFVICSNVLGGCQGSTGPSSPALDGKPYALRFPVVTISDMVQAQQYLIERLGIHKLFSVVGGSMGGMQALQWAVDYPDQVGSVLFLASTPRSSPQSIALNETGRQAIYADPNWNQGDYYGGAVPAQGLAIARMIGHITYMSETSFERKFSRTTHRGAVQYDFGIDFSVESYLRYQGEKFVKRFDANSYLYITKALDYFDISDGYESLEAALKKTQCKFLIVTFSSDWLYPPEQSWELVDTLERLGRSVKYQHVEAYLGHDSFLVEVELMTALIGGYLNELWDAR